MEHDLELYFKRKLEEYLLVLKQMVSINSYTVNQRGVNVLGEFTADLFSGLGFISESIQSSNLDFGKHLILTRQGSSGKKIGLITHLDTVFSLSEQETNQFYWHREGDRIYGPGTNDIKGGTIMIYMMMDAINHFARDVFDKITWILLANAAEERWSFDFGELCRERLETDGIAALVFEAGYYENNKISLVTARKGMAVYDITVEGKSAHAGNAHSEGANALLQISELIQQVSNLTDYKRDLTFNIGVLSGGTVPNRVPHFANARGEMRAFDKDIFYEAVNKLLLLNSIEPLSSADGNYPCKIDIQIILENSPWPNNPNTMILFDLWKTVASTMGITTIQEARGGLSDGNQLWDLIPTIDGLGPNGKNAHCSEKTQDGSKDQEFVTISSFVPKATLNTLATLDLIKQQ